MKTYCMGLVYTSGNDEVVLIKKTHPRWQAGLWNGVGGHVREGETPKQAMERECREETGLQIAPMLWEHLAVMDYAGDGAEPDVRVHVLAATGTRASEATTQTDERVAVHPVAFALQFLPLVTDLKWLLPLGQQRRHLREPIMILRHDL